MEEQQDGRHKDKDEWIELKQDRNRWDKTHRYDMMGEPLCWLHFSLALSFSIGSGREGD